MAKYPRYKAGDTIVAINNVGRVIRGEEYHISKYKVSGNKEYVYLREIERVSFHISHFEPKPLFGEIMASKIETLIRHENGLAI